MRHPEPISTAFSGHPPPQGLLGGNRMSRRPVSLARQIVERSRNSVANSMHSRTQQSRLLSVGLLLLGAILLICYAYSASGRSGNHNQALDRLLEGDSSCAADFLRALPILKKVYGNSMHKILHVGPDTCSVVSILLKEDDSEAWGVEPYNLDDTTSAHCKRLVRQGIVRVADIKYPLPYRAQSFSLVIISDVVDYLSPRYLNTTLIELTRVAADGVVIFAGYPGQHRAKLVKMSKFGRPAKLRSATWWIRFFNQYKFEENDSAMKKFEQTSNKRGFKPSCHVFNLKPELTRQQH
uniref:S-adenosyl-L-methionine-dependent methyltransferase n=2 Tax=Kalanchoe fedtschenkoi TaxID=63787 RepID=A0A7N0ZWT4_KALFE